MHAHQSLPFLFIKMAEVHGSISDDRTLALLAAIPSARFCQIDDPNADVVLVDNGETINGFFSAVQRLGGDPGLVSNATASNLNFLNEYLLSRTFLQWNDTSVTDRLVFGLLYRKMASLSDEAQYSSCSLSRWFDHIQYIISQDHLPYFPNVVIKLVVDSKSGKQQGAAKEKKPKKVKLSASGKESNPFLEDAASLDIRIGKVVSVEAHPTDPSLYLEKIDLGEVAGPRQVVSGLANFVSVDEMMNRDVCVLVNISASDVKGVPSSGLVLCASNADHTVVVPILPPKGVVPGDKVMFPGVNNLANPEQIKPKKLHKLFKMLRTSDEDAPTANCGDLPFMTNRGRISAPSTLRNCQIK
uniref:tRNA-binding domain-containing protein n=1 Tax=Spongospora subterranea TaxID=70186 RepID=A0A0H5R798_9EUKA|eukprot:CRZ09627.1 hypothetical protein [Spongospora subterranea]